MDHSRASTRRRVRTGCLTCRARRRKCDEDKPDCRNCTTKGLVCRYGSRITFTAPWTALPRPAPAPARTAGPRGGPDDDLSSLPAAPPAAEDGTGLDGSPAASQSHGRNEHFSAPPPSGTPPALGPDPPAVSPVTAHLDASTRPCPLPDASYAPQTEDVVRTSYNDVTTPSTTIHEVASARQDGTNPWTPLPSVDTGDEPPMRLISALGFYRDRVATIMDLESSEAFWGVEVLHMSIHSQYIRNAILAVTAQHFHHANSGEELLSSGILRVADSTSFVREEGQLVSLLRALQMMLSADPKTWLTGIRDLGLGTWPGDTHKDHRQFGDRVILAAILNAPSDTLAEGFPLIHSMPAVFQLDSARCRATQLKQALCLLSRSLYFLPESLSRNQKLLPVNSAWLACWSEAQLWYSMRSDDIRPLFDALTLGATVSDEGSNDFPHLLFSSAVALVANVAHHLTALLLLEHKPRLLHVVAESESSTFAPWHALQILGVAAAALELGFWDPLLATAIVKAGQKLSHPVQQLAASRTLTSMCAISGMQFQTEIGVLESLAQMDFSNAF